MAFTIRKKLQSRENVRLFHSEKTFIFTDEQLTKRFIIRV
ncbi:hypothetical protein HMPREF1990_01002 [Porphyromonas gingivalis W4087]|uniref:Uncharacterized protein n=1 Tax=Porphyromonas gingivalis F0570 TaxID=1227271 RepID=A0A0E2M3N1_PORGN|nr:hypothetical protein HMPREF1322_1235 [Porphyromonas gingivalis W50]ERJ64522.1 hypothetical protein HMPREF1555_01778 [Porphyromonas gingivalis F0570]ERJ68289.1 hypothetical protein HMPREF1553_01129 [Porphyromonas gingivalis F0568]ERJ86040.1 hypothetical protein HMPREF1989_01464 [Porphyromonas gingivalis F0566]ERJ89184.1 hypothetical protein HMPREF1990_01002 [Porphyromonas gingivalis W4087]